MRILRPLALSLVLLAPAFAVAQDSGTAGGTTTTAPADSGGSKGFVASTLESSLSGPGRKVTVTGFSGALSSKAQIQQMTIADDQGVWLTLKGVVLDWSRLALLTGKVQVNELSADEIDVARTPVAAPSTAPAAEASGPFQLPSLPVSVHVGKIEAKVVKLGQPVLGQAAELSVEGKMDLAGGEGDVNLQIQRTDGQQGKFSIDGSYVNKTQNLALDIETDEAAKGIITSIMGLPGAPALALSIKGEGPLNDYTANIRLATAGQDRVTGTVHVAQAAAQDGQPAPPQTYTADIGGDIAPLFAPQYQSFFGTDIRLQMAGSKAADGSFDLTKLALQSKAMTLNGKLSLGPDKLPKLIDFTGRIASADGKPVLLPLSGDETRIGSADLKVAFDAAKGDGWTGTLQIAGLDQASLKAKSLTLNGSGTIRQANGGAADGTFDISGQGLAPADPNLATALGQTLAGKIGFAWQSGQPLQLPQIALNGKGYKLDGSGSIDGLSSSGTVSGQITASVDDLAPFSGLAGRPLGGAAEITARGSGAALAGSFDIDTTVEGTNLRAGIPQVDGLLKGKSTVHLSAKRDKDGTDLRDLTVNATTLDLKAAGVVKTGASNLHAQMKFSDLGVMGPGYGGTLDADLSYVEGGGVGHLNGTMTGQNLLVAQEQGDKLLRGTTTLTLAGTRRGDQFQIDTLKLANPQIDASVAGLVKQGANNLSATFGLKNLEALGPGYGGTMQLKADYVEQGGAGHLTAKGAAHELSIGQPQADGLLQGDTALAVDATRRGSDIRIDTFTLKNPHIDAVANGLVKQGESDIKASLSLVGLNAMGRGYNGSVKLQAAYAEQNGAGHLTASGTAKDLAIGQGQADALLHGDTTLSVDATRKGNAISIAKFEVKNPQLSATADGSVGDGGKAINLDARLANLGLVVPGFPGPLTVKGTLGQNAKGYSVNIAATGPGALNAKVAGSVATDFKSANLSASGGIQSAIANPMLQPRSIQGPVKFDIRVNGPLALSSVSGDVRLGPARLAAPTLGINANAVTADVHLAGGRAQLSGKATIGGGTITLSGPVTLSGNYDGALAINLSRVLLKNPDLYSAPIGGKITLNGPLTGGAKVVGRLRLGSTELRVPSTGLGGGASVPGLVHVGESAAQKQTRARAGLIEKPKAASSSGGSSRPYILDITVDAPNQVFIRGRGLDAELGGSVHLAGTSDNIVPSGGFKLIRGRLDILGKRFDLSTATLQLEGKFVPYVDISASSENDGVTSTITISGEATDPQISFSSSPAMPQEEVLSQLLFGHGLNNITAFQAAQLASAVATLAGKGGDGIVGNLRKKFGLDNFDVTTDSSGNAAVKAGKYLSKRVYTEVTVGSSGSTQVQLNFDVTKSVTLRGTAAADGSSGVGVYYERDY